MFCESYRQKLSEAAMQGERLPREAEAHVAACDSCRAAFAEEQALFGLIETGLRTAANAQVPASLLPRVRAEIAAVPTSTWAAWRNPALAFASVTVILGVLAFSVAQSRHVGRAGAPIADVSVSKESPSEVESNRSDESPAGIAAQRKLPALAKKDPLPPLAATGAKPEVVISAVEADGLRRYSDSLRVREAANARTRAHLSDVSAEIKPLEIAAMDWKELNIEPLEGGGSR